MPEVFICEKASNPILVPSPYPEFQVFQEGMTTDGNRLFVLDTGDEELSIYEALPKGDCTGFILISGGNSIGNFHNAKQVEAVYRDLVEDPTIEVVVEIQPDDHGLEREIGVLLYEGWHDTNVAWLFGVVCSSPRYPGVFKTLVRWLSVEQLKVLSVTTINQPSDRHHEA